MQWPGPVCSAGADVTLLASTGCTLPPVPFVKMVPYTTAADLFAAVQQHAMDADALVMAAAVADYRPATVAQDKVKKKDGEMTLALERTQDILALGGRAQAGKALCLRILHGNAGSHRKLHGQTAQKAYGYDCGQQSEGAGRPGSGWTPMW